MTECYRFASHALRATSRPDFEVGDRAVRVVDLFSGCGGLSLGLAIGLNDRGLALEIPLAVDSDSEASAVYQANFPKAAVWTCDVQDVFDGELASAVTSNERRNLDQVGPVDLLIGGPPCQGHSDLNNHTRRKDLKNLLYLQMVRAAIVLKPTAILIENVPTIRHDKFNVLSKVRMYLDELGYAVAEDVLKFEELGVPQRRRRHILLAVVKDRPHPRWILRSIGEAKFERRNLAWAIGDLADVANRGGTDRVPAASPANQLRMSWLLENDEYDLPNWLRPKCHQGSHSYRSMYGRLRWNEPAQTITSGFGSIGQGRYMHPDEARALTAHEAARIQGFPDYFDFSAVERRASLAMMIGNAVPSQLGREVLGRAAMTVI